MRLLNTFLIASLLLGIVGCASESTMSKAEEDALVNRRKEMPPEAAEAMQNMGESMRKQQEANAAAGVDSRGVPLSKSTEKAPPPTGN